MGSPAPLAALHFPLVFSLRVAVCQCVSGRTRCRPRHGGRSDVGTAVMGVGWAKKPTPSLPVPPRQGQAASAVVFAPWGAAGRIRHPGLPKVLLHPWETRDGMGWDGMSRDGMSWDGMGWDGGCIVGLSLPSISQDHQPKGETEAPCPGKLRQRGVPAPTLPPESLRAPQQGRGVGCHFIYHRLPL